MRCIRPIPGNLPGILLVMLSLLPPMAAAQSSSRVNFGVSPTVFAAGQASSAVLSVSNVTNTPLTLSLGDTFSFFLDPSIGIATAILAPPSVSSANLSAGDFAATRPSASQVTITYNGQSKPFSYGDTLSVEVALALSGQIGTGKVSFLSRFTGSVNGSLPYTTVSLVNFANVGAAAVAHDTTLTGQGTGAAPLGVAVPLTLAGSVSDVLTVTGTGSGNAQAALFQGGPGPGSAGSFGGGGLRALGGSGGPDGFGGFGIVSVGGDAGSGPPGDGVVGAGGKSTNNSGNGVTGFGGDGTNNGVGGNGVFGLGGDGFGGGNGGNGGMGVVATGGTATGLNHSGGDGIFASAGGGATNGLAGIFDGDLHVNGNLSKTSGSFKIDHPLDPANKYLYHSFVESPDMMNIYNGIVKLDSIGEAVVELPEWFGALNKDFRYQLTCVGGFAPVYIGHKVSDNRFKIAGGLPGMEVSWQVTGIRQDAWANAHRIPVEQDKSEQERGHYLHPELFNEPEEKSVEWARHPQLMQQIKDKRDHTSQTAHNRIRQPGS